MAWPFTFSETNGVGAFGKDGFEKKESKITIRLEFPRFGEATRANVPKEMLEGAGVEVGPWRRGGGKADKLVASKDTGGVVNTCVGGPGGGNSDDSAIQLGSETAAVLAGKGATYSGPFTVLCDGSKLACTGVAIINRVREGPGTVRVGGVVEAVRVSRKLGQAARTLGVTPGPGFGTV